MTNGIDTLPPWPELPSGGGSDGDYDGELIAALRARLEVAVMELRGMASALEGVATGPKALAKICELEDLIRACQEPTP